MAFVSGHSRPLSGERHHLWKGGRIVRKGYVLVHLPGHHLADVKGYAPEHRVIAEQMLGRPLTADEVVHHLNRVKDDNREENLVVMPKRAHTLEHVDERREALRRFNEANPDHCREAGLAGARARWGG